MIDSVCSISMSHNTWGSLSGNHFFVQFVLYYHRLNDVLEPLCVTSLFGFFFLIKIYIWVKMHLFAVSTRNPILIVYRLTISVQRISKCKFFKHFLYNWIKKKENVCCLPWWFAVNEFFARKIFNHRISNIGSFTALTHKRIERSYIFIFYDCCLPVT